MVDLNTFKVLLIQLLIELKFYSVLKQNTFWMV